MRAAAEAAVAQHILYLEGECLPRPELIETLQGWLQLHRLIEEHICPASRTQALAPAEVPAALDQALAGYHPPVPALIRRTLERCAACPSSGACPLDLQPIRELGWKHGGQMFPPTDLREPAASAPSPPA